MTEVDMALRKADKGKVPIKLKRDTVLGPESSKNEMSLFELEIEASRARQKKRKQKK